MGFWWCLLLAVVFEAITCLLRFGFGLSPHSGGRVFAKFTFGIRVHHGYIGLLLVLLSYLPLSKRATVWMFRIGVALVISDLIHHLLVLWPLEGNPQLNFFYPG
jgi:hypothetical protein